MALAVTDQTASILGLAEQSVISISVQEPCCTALGTDVAGALTKCRATPDNCG